LQKPRYTPIVIEYHSQLHFIKQYPSVNRNSNNYGLNTQVLPKNWKSHDDQGLGLKSKEK